MTHETRFRPILGFTVIGIGMVVSLALLPLLAVTAAIAILGVILYYSFLVLAEYLLYGPLLWLYARVTSLTQHLAPLQKRTDPTGS